MNFTLTYDVDVSTIHVIIEEFECPYAIIFCALFTTSFLSAFIAHYFRSNSGGYSQNN